ncbi:MAG: DUF2344 domain-containing protein [Tissierellia bacterium]|nr:DUF2344 domain-containing protein [Tissierellia bacterium]
MKIRVTYKKRGMIKYISHLDTMRLFHRTFRRMEIPILFSQGFNPHMLMSLANPLALGVESDIEFMDFETDYNGDLNTLMGTFNKGLPNGIEAYQIEEAGDISVNEIVKWSVYEFDFLNDYGLGKEEIEDKVSDILRTEEIIIEKRAKKKGKKTLVKRNVRDFIKDIEVSNLSGDSVILQAILRSSSTGGLNPIEFTKILQSFIEISKDVDTVNILRIDQHDEEGSSLKAT